MTHLKLYFKISILCLLTAQTLISCKEKNQEIQKTIPSGHELVFKNLASSWDEGIPLGNAMLGALIWKNEDKLRISLDRADLWDLRPMENLDFENYDFNWVWEQWKSNTYKNVQQKYDSPYSRLPAPSKIPGGAMEFDIQQLGPIAYVKLSTDDAICEVKWENGTTLNIFVHATEPIGWYKFENLSGDLKPQIVPPLYYSDKESKINDPVSGQDLRRLNYPKGELQTTENSITYNQKGWSEFEFQVHTKWDQEDDVLVGSWSITSKKDPLDKTKNAVEIVEAQHIDKIDTSLTSHKAWWQDFWNRSNITVPDSILQHQWYMEKYKLGAAARKGAPPISLQSIWTADNGKLPPWKGDFHHDLNTQLSYWPTYSGNHLDLEEGFIDWLDAHKSAFLKYTKEFYGTNGLNVPGVTTLTGEPMGGWIQYAFGPTTGAWLGHHFYLHWRYSMDRTFLEQRAYPWIKGVAIHFDELSIVGEDGKRRLPLSSTPEINNNARDAWFDKTTNYDLGLIRWTYEKASELAYELGKVEEAKEWEQKLKQWPNFAVMETGLMISPDMPYEESHRHFSHLLAYHPLGIIDVSKGDEDHKTITNTLANLESAGTAAWTGYSFSWLANLKARAFDGEGAAKALKIFATSFCLPNSFHVNGDQSGKGYSDFTYRPFTLEGNFAFMAGIQEMLIQSHSGSIQLFPAVPKDWKDISFESLRTEGAFLISASMQEDAVATVKITAEKGGKVNLKNPFNSKDVHVDDNNLVLQWEGNVMNFELKPGQSIILTEN